MLTLPHLRPSLNPKSYFRMCGFRGAGQGHQHETLSVHALVALTNLEKTYWLMPPVPDAKVVGTRMLIPNPNALVQ